MKEDKAQTCSHIINLQILEPNPSDSTDSTHQPHQIGVFDFFRFATIDQKRLAFVAALFSATAGAFIPIFTNEIANATTVIQSSLEGGIVVSFLNEVGLKFLYFGLAMLVAMSISNILWFIVAEKQAAAIRKAYFHALLNQELAFYDMTAPTTILASFSNDLDLIQSAISNKIGVMFQIVGCLIATLIYIFITAWLLSVVCLGMLPLVILTGYLYLKSYEGRTTQYKQIYERAGEVSEQAFFAIKTVKQMNSEQREIKKYDHQLQNVADKQFNISAKIGLSIGAMNFCFFALNALTYWFGSECMLDSSICPKSSSKQDYTPRMVSQVYYLILNCYYLVVVVTPTLSSLNQGRDAASKILNVIDRQPTIKLQQPGSLILDQFKGIIKFINVSFAYPSNKSKKVLNNVNFQFPIRNNVILGESGCGKSTIIQLVLRIYDPDEGVILVDNHDIRSYNLRWLRNHIGFVEQQPLLFAGTIRDNFLLYCPHARSEDIDFALKQAEIYDFVNKDLEMGLNTEVGMRGQMLSGGQKQRIALARALLKKPKIMLFDEFTSALDQQNERRILRNLSKLPYKMNIISITHRIQVMKASQYCYFMQSGQILQQGKFDELVFYKQICMLPHSSSIKHLFSKVSVKEVLKKIESIRQTGRQLGMRQTNAKISSRQIEINQNVANLRMTELDALQLIREEEQGKDMRPIYEMALLKFIDNFNSSAQQQVSMFQLLGKLYSYNKNRKCLFFVAFLLSFLVGLIIPAMSWVSSKIYASLFKLTIPATLSDGLDLRKSSLYIFVGLSLGYFILTFFQILSTYILGSEITKNIRSELYSKLLKMPMCWFQRSENNPGVLTQKLSQGCDTISQLSSVLVFVVTVMMTGVIACYAIGFAFNWQISLLGFAFLPLIILFVYLKSSFSNRIAKLLERVRQQSNVILSESLVGIKTVTALNVSNQLYSRYSEIQDRPYQEVFDLGVKMGLISAVGNCLNFAVLGTLFYFTGQLLQLTNYQVNLQYALVALFQSLNVTFLINSNYHFLPNISQAKQIAANVLNYFEYQDEDMMQKKEESQMLTSGIGQGCIQFKNITFAYESRGDTVFDRFSIRLTPHRNVSIVGRSGCGKSTILNLLQRFYIPSEGQILIDGINIKDYDIHYLRSKYGAVGQQPILINDTIGECVRYGCPTANEAEVIAACQKANAIGFIMNGVDSDEEQEAHPVSMKVPHNLSWSHKDTAKSDGVGFDKMVGFNGSHLSGGQKQRIAIARMLMLDPSIFLFDEVTSALDMQNEAKIMKLLKSVSKGKTTLNISHKLGTLKQAEEIIMMDKGRVVERGSYEELRNKEGYFTNLRKTMSMAPSM